LSIAFFGGSSILGETALDLSVLKDQVAQQLELANTLENLKDVRVSLLGRKGVFAEHYDRLKLLDPHEKKEVGQQINALKMDAEGRLSQLEVTLLEQARIAREIESSIDITLPGKRPVVGRKHPITSVLDEIIRIFSSLGFGIAEGPDIESDYYNFEALNIPKDHPARDMQDTFYVMPGIVLRTQTSSVQIRTMEQNKPPIRIISPGSVYRHDQDISHTPMFHQVEGLMVDKGVSFADLKGILHIFIHEMFGKDVPVRFRPSYFPFTEPSAEVDIGCVICKGSGCGVCKTTGWLEILGSGTVHPQVFRNIGYDPMEVSGFAFGMGVERIAMIKFGIDDIKQFYNNDVRFLSQF
jgi:phenylalanyl-tRNA synthetase alpha chain